MMPEAPVPEYAISSLSRSTVCYTPAAGRRGAARVLPQRAIDGLALAGIYFSVLSFFVLFCFADCLIFDINDIIKPFFLEAKCYKSSFRQIIIKFGSQRTRSVKNFVITLKSNSITSVRFCKTLYTSPKSRVTSFKKKKQIRFYQQNDINIFCIYREIKFDLPENSIN